MNTHIEFATTEGDRITAPIAIIVLRRGFNISNRVVFYALVGKNIDCEISEDTYTTLNQILLDYEV